jgi:hypothetical protein
VQVHRKRLILPVATGGIEEMESSHDGQVLACRTSSSNRTQRKSPIANLLAHQRFRKAAELFVVVAVQGRAMQYLEKQHQEMLHFELPLERIRVPLLAFLTVGSIVIQRRISRTLDLEKYIDYFVERKDPFAPLASG